MGGTVTTLRVSDSEEGPGRYSIKSKSQPELNDLMLIERVRMGDQAAMARLIDRYRGFVRMKASSYFLAGGESEDLIQEGLIGFYKAVRDYRPDREASFRSFAELCVNRQIITAIKTAARHKHTPLNTYVSFSHTRAVGGSDQEISLADVLPTDPVVDPASQVIAAQELRALLDFLGDVLSELESGVLTMYCEGRSYEEIASRLDCAPKAVDNALQRVKRKITTHLKSRAVPDSD